MADPSNLDPQSVGLGAIAMGLLGIIMIVFKRLLSAAMPNGEQSRLRDDLGKDFHEALAPIKEDIAELKNADLAVRVAVLERRMDDRRS